MVPDLSNVDISIRFQWAAENLKPHHTDYRVIYEDPAYPDDPVVLLSPAPEWMACALAGGILSEVEHQHNMKLELVTDDGEIIQTTFIESQQIYLDKKIVKETVLNYDEYIMSKPIGPMTEEEAIEYLIMKDVPARVWHSDYKYNRQMFKIIKMDQLPKDRKYTDCWRLA